MTTSISRRTIAALLPVFLLATGCATVEKTPLSVESKQKIRTIAVVAVPEPEKYFLNPAPTPGGQALYMFGALGGLVLGGIEATRAKNATDEFTASVSTTNPDVAEHWNESVLASLQSRGYAVTKVPPLPMLTDGKKVDCNSVSGKFDAVLLTTISAGYAVESAVEPLVHAQVQLLSSSCSDVHFSDAFLYSAKAVGSNTHIAREAKYSFPSREALLANPGTAKEAMRAGLSEIARKVSSVL